MVNIHTARTALYRLHDKGGVLLYVGITNMPNVRFAAHSLKPWWKRVTRKDIVWFDNRREAEQAETGAIRSEKPLYNVAKSPWRTAGTPVDLCDLPPNLDELDLRIVEAVRVRHAAKEELQGADDELRELVAFARGQGVGPAKLAKLTGFTREWVARIAPAPKS